jgi:cell division protein YceG involved in septum cleavage
VRFDEQVLDGMVRNPQIFLDYDFITQISKKEGRDWTLQGYLFPDTYAFDVNTTRRPSCVPSSTTRSATSRRSTSSGPSISA